MRSTMQLPLYYTELPIFANHSSTMVYSEEQVQRFSFIKQTVDDYNTALGKGLDPVKPDFTEQEIHDMRVWAGQALSERAKIIFST